MDQKNYLRIIHLSTSHDGGAGIAARRLNRSLVANGIASTFVALARSDFKLDIYEVSVKRAIYRKLVGAINSKLSYFLKKETYFTLFSVSSISYKKLNRFGPPQSTIFHVHNWFNLINIRTMRKLLESGYQLIFTLHDQRLFTGGCHYSLSCEKYKTDCVRCPLLPFPVKHIPKRNLEQTQYLFNTFANQISVIAPSNWIGKSAVTSSILRQVEVNQITNPHIEFLEEKKSFRNISFSNYINLLTIGVASMDIKSPLKNGHLLPELEILINSRKIPVKIIYLADYKKNGYDSNTFWNTINYLLVISKIDNSPNVIHEAKIFGVPIIATNVGGITELLNLEYDFLISSSKDVLKETIEVFETILNKRPVHNPSKIISDYKRDSSGNLQMIIDLYKTTLRVS